MRFLSFSSTFATLVLSQSVASTVPADPASRACGEIVREANGSSTWFSASDAIACLQSVPFNAPIASRFLRYVNTTVQFQSSLEWLKDPPAEYQQIAIDVVGSFAQIQNRINTGYYQNQFQFESELQRVLYDTNDGHLTLFGGLFNVFTFSSERFVVSVSEDGVRLPKVYLAGDLRASARGGRRPSAISTINSQDVISYLTGFANKQTVGVVEPHAEWNQLFENPARDIQGADSAFGGSASFYPGDNVVFGFEDGTEKRYEFLARYYSPGPTGPLETGGDMFNFFVLGLYPASYVEEDATEDDSDEEVAPPDVIGASWSDTELSFAYPTANISQHNLGGEDGEVLTAYFLPGTSTAVLSIPSFAQSGDNIQSFTEVVENFTTRARELGSKRCIIDLQQNTGGDVSLAIDTFKRFFPDEDPFTGSRRRKHVYGDVLGEAHTNYFTGDQIKEDDGDTGYLYQALAGSEWMISNKVNPETDRAYTSWSEYSPPGAGDLTLAETYNFSDPLFINGSFQGFAPFGYLDNAIQSSYTTPFAPENIIILTDGQCASACNIFLEAMVTDGGVRTVVAGGRPEPGPMQAGSGTRSAVTYSADQLATDFEVAGVLDETAISLLPQDYATDVITRYLGVSLRQQVRRDDPTPLQFRYLAADCRIYYTMANWNNFTRLYLDVDTIFDSPSLCVAGSTGYARRGTSQPDNPPPRRRSPMGSYIAGGLQPQTPLNSPASPFTPIEAEVDPSLAGLVLACNSDSQCDTGYKRVFWNRTCSSQPVRVCGCLPKCNYYAGGAQSDECETDAPCQRDAAQSGKGNAAVNFDGYSSSTSSEQGRCKPNDRYIASVTCGSTPPPDDPPSPVYSKVKDTKAKKKTTKKCRGQGCVRRV